MRIGLSIVVSALIGLGLTYLVREAALRAGFVAAPRNDRWHRKPTALMGGVAIYLSFIIGSFIFIPDLKRAYPILIAATILFGIGIIDDVIQLKPYIKLAMQMIAASITVFGGLHLPWTASAPLNDFITIFWLVGITNAVNLLDNMDGLAGGISVIACIFMAITFVINGQSAEAALPLILAGAIAGFLWFNFNPATIFMGDCGSMFIGFALSGIALLSDFGRARNLISVLLTPALILMIPIFDTCVVTVTRKLSGRPVSQGGRDHTSHRLVALGMSERRAVLMLYLFAAISGAMALMVRQMRIEVTLLLISGFALSVLFIGLYLGKVRVYEEGETAAGTLVDVLANFSHRRRIFEMMLDSLLIVLAYYSAYLLRFDGAMPGEQVQILINTLPLIVAIQIFLFLAGGVYRGIWRYAGIDELISIARSVFAGSIVTGLTVLFLYKFFGPSRAVFILYGVLLLVFVGASRISFRLLGALIVGRRQSHPDAKPVLIYGAGDRGDMLIRELLNNPAYCYQLVGFIDDDVMKAGKLLRGYRIFPSDELPRLINSHGVCEVLISSLDVPDSKLDDIRNLGIGFKRLRIQLD
jgi:UDP-GlcNAc:undecaprenyl-phosphate GlcNAc-1-phosphate transferase